MESIGLKGPEYTQAGSFVHLALLGEGGKTGLSAEQLLSIQGRAMEQRFGPPLCWDGFCKDVGSNRRVRHSMPAAQGSCTVR